jgi:hypothetical protein
LAGATTVAACSTGGTSTQPTGLGASFGTIPAAPAGPLRLPVTGTERTA